MLGLLLAITVTAAVALDPGTRTTLGPLETVRLREEVRVEGGTEVTTVELALRNEGARAFEGVLSVALPPGAAVISFALDVGGELREGVVVPRAKARDAYGSVVRRRIDPGLVERVGEDRYRIRVFPVPARGERRLLLRYALEPPAPRDGPVAPAVSVEADRFCVRAAAPDTGVRRMAPRRVLVVVDASLSEASRDRARDAAFLEAYARLLGEAEVRLLVLSEGPRTPAPASFLVRDGAAPELVSAVAAIVAGGALCPASIDLARALEGVDAAILLGDALPTIGESGLAFGAVPVARLVAPPADPVAAARRALARPWTLARIDAPPGRISGLSLDPGARLEGRTIVLRGRVSAGPPVPVALHLRRGHEDARIDLVVDPAESAAGAVVDAAPKVTARTSLLVLERIEDYVAWRIAPPGGLLADYERRVATIEAKRAKVAPPAPPAALTAEEKDRAWAERVAWWERAFTPSEGFRWYPGTSVRGGWESACYFAEVGSGDPPASVDEDAAPEPEMATLPAIVERADALRAAGESALAVRALTSLAELWPSRAEVHSLLQWKLEEAGAVTLSAIVARDLERRFPAEARPDPSDRGAYVLGRVEAERSLDLDLRVVCEGAALEVIEPTEEPVYRSEPSALGGRVTETWSPSCSEYALRRARPGTYHVRVSRGFAARVTVVRAFGRPEETRSVRVLLLPPASREEGEALTVEVPAAR